MDKDLRDLIENPIFLDLLNNLSEYVYITDNKGYVQFINTAAEKCEHISYAETKGKHINDIYTQKESPTLKALETGQKIDEHENLYMIDGKQYSQLCKSFPLYKDKKIIGACTLQRDTTYLNQILSDNSSLKKSQRTNSKPKVKTFDSLIGQHPDFRNSVNLARSSAGNDSPVLLSGFTGSGKEIFANAIHNASARKNEPFLAVNCAAVPDGLLESILFGTTKGTFTGSIDKIGLFEQAKGGTLFLDEINSMSLNSQAKLLRVLEEKEIRRLGGYNDISIDVRIISSINTTPALALANNQLREDLFYRLSVTTILIPPLNGRNDDIDLITEHFINKFNKVFNKNITGLSDEVHNFFMTYSWPGNVRQLKHVIESAINSADSSSSRILMSDLPYYLFESSTTHVERFQYIPKQSEDLSAMAGAPTANPSYGAYDAPAEVSDCSSVPTYSSSVSPENLYDTIRQQEKKNIMDALLSCSGNVTKAARILGMNRQQLVYRMRKYNINR